MSLNVTDKNKTALTELNFFGRLNFKYFDTIRDIKFRQIAKKKFKIFWCEKYSEFLKIVD